MWRDSYPLSGTNSMISLEARERIIIEWIDQGGSGGKLRENNLHKLVMATIEPYFLFVVNERKGMIM